MTCWKNLLPSYGDFGIFYPIMLWVGPIFRFKKKRVLCAIHNSTFLITRMQKFVPKTIKLHPKFFLVFARSHSIGPSQNNFENYSPKKSASLWSTFNRLWRFIFGQKLWYEVQYYWEHLEEHIGNMRNMLGTSLRTCWGTHWEHGEKIKMQKNQIPHKQPPPLTWAV